MAYALKTYEDDNIVVYQYGISPETGIEGSFVISRATPSDWHIFTSMEATRRAEVTYRKALALFRETGEWRKGVGFNS